MGSCGVSCSGVLGCGTEPQTLLNHVQGILCTYPCMYVCMYVWMDGWMDEVCMYVGYVGM